ncbi:YitT family protein [Saccharicrinis aurantiacus]|uniref:YitT family protein n=1 Tax=Saccharicrinis aurantiacus TaxID=1849719 RepID=UPI0008386553|nr:YitT family protein [Saccharicrinis aurantiacus]
MTKEKILKESKSYFILTFALFMASIGWSGFIIPTGVVGGGITGLSTMAYYLWGWDVGLTGFVINICLILMAIKILGFSFGVKSVYGIVVFAIFIDVLMEQFGGEPLVSDAFMATLIGASMAGTGGGLIFVNGGSTGGTDIIAMIINKYRNISLGKLLLMLDVVIILSAYFVFHDIEKVMYGFITMATFGYAVDLVISGNKSTVQLFIISPKYKEISDKIIKTAEKGVTILDGMGGYSGDSKKVLMVISKKRTSTVLFRIIKEIDPEAFVTMGSVSGVYGKGFDQIKI